MNHLETLIKQFYEWKQYVVRTNIKVGPLKHGGFEGELDIVAYNPKTQHLVHLEPSIDAHSWATRQARFQKKFEAGRKYISKTVFPWLSPETPIHQFAILVSSGKSEVGGGAVISADEFVAAVREDIAKEGVMAKAAIPEQYDLLRTIQFVTCGYYRVVQKTSVILTR
jgi:hypothetical protein